MGGEVVDRDLRQLSAPVISTCLISNSVSREWGMIEVYFGAQGRGQSAQVFVIRVVLQVLLYPRQRG